MRILLIFAAVTCLSGCENAVDGGEAAAGSGYATNKEAFCSQANSILDQAESEQGFPYKEWGNVVMSSARLVYVVNECGMRVQEGLKVLCAALHDNWYLFIAAETVPRGINRDRIINQNRRVYDQAGCQPALIYDGVLIVNDPEA